MTIEPGRPFRPMEPRLVPEPFDDPAWAFQVKWDGIRLLAHLTGDGVRLFTRRGHERRWQYPEVSEALASLFAGRRAVFDGEAIVLPEDRPSFQHVLRRDRAGRPETVLRLREELPVTYVIFDLLYWEGEELTERPLEERLAALARLPLEESPSLHPAETYWHFGRSLYEATGRQGLEGIVAKRRESPYLAGRKTDLWQKIKHRRRDRLLVGGYLSLKTPLSSLLLGRQVEEGLQFAGRVNVALPEADRRRMLESLNRLRRAHSPFLDRLPGLEGTVTWLEPRVTAEVEYLERTEAGELRHARLVGFSGESARD